MQARAHAPLFDVEAPYVAEMARLELRQRFGPSAESAGYKVYTTIDGRLQADANRAVRVGLIEYDRRHGWRGPAGHVDLPAHGEPDLDDLVDEYAAIGNLAPAIITEVGDKSARAYVKTLGAVEIDWEGLSWARKRAAQRDPGCGAEGCRAGAQRAATSSTWWPMTRGTRSSGRSRKRKARWWRWIRTTAASWPWSAASTTSPTSTTA